METSHLGHIAVLFGAEVQNNAPCNECLSNRKRQKSIKIFWCFMFGGQMFPWRHQSHNCTLTREQTRALTQNQVCRSHGDVSQWMCYMSEIPCYALFFSFLLISSWGLGFLTITYWSLCNSSILCKKRYYLK